MKLGHATILTPSKKSKPSRRQTRQDYLDSKKRK